MTFLTRLDALLSERRLTKSELARGSGIPYTTIDGWYKKGFREIRLSTLEKLAAYFGLPVDYFTVREEGLLPYSPGGELPVIGRVSAGFGGGASEEFLGYERVHALKNPQECVWFLVKGDSMAPYILDGDYALVRRQPDVESGDVAVVIYGEEYGTLKKIGKSPGALSLIPLNPAYETRVLTGEALASVMIYGRVIETKRVFEHE